MWPGTRVPKTLAPSLNKLSGTRHDEKTAHAVSLQLRVLCFGFFQDGDVTVGVSSQSGFELCPSRRGRQKAHMPPKPVSNGCLDFIAVLDVNDVIDLGLRCPVAASISGVFDSRLSMSPTRLRFTTFFLPSAEPIS
jgi:hypothetical protein